MTWALKSSYTAHETRDYSFELEEWRDDDGNQMLFVHLLVTFWSPSILREMFSVFAKFREAVTCPLYALNHEEDARWEKFISLFGFKYLTNMLCENGESCRLFMNTLTKDNNNE